MGVVYRAYDSEADQEVALKLIHPRIDSANASTRFQRELEVVSRLSHPNIVAAHDAGLIGETPYLAMELIDGVDVSKALRVNESMKVADACELIRQAAIGLQYIDESGFVHRDLKPGT